MTAKKCLLDNGSIPVVSRAHQAVVEAIATPVKAAQDMSKNKVAELKKSINALKFTWVIADRLKELGYQQAEKINDLLKTQRSYRESLMRHAEDVIQPFSQLHALSKETALKVDDLGARSTLAEVNPFMPRKRYEGKRKRVTLDGVEMTPAEAHDILTKELEALRAMKHGDLGAKVLKNVFDSYRRYRRELLDSIIKSYKDRFGEGHLADDEVSPNVYSLIKRTKDQFEQNDNDAY